MLASVVAVLSLFGASLVGVVAPPAAGAAAAAVVRVDVSGASLGNITLSPFTLTPRFRPGIRDYAIHCQEGVNNAVLLLTGAAGGTITVGGYSGTWLPVVQALVENQAIVVSATNPANPSGPPAEYWIRCLPHDFPKVQVIDSGAAPAGWYLTGNSRLAMNGVPSGNYAFILNEHGTPVWYWPTPFGVVYTTLLSGNRIAWAPNLGPGFGTRPDGAFQLFDLDTRTSTNFVPPVRPLDPHDLVERPNGNRIVLATPLRSGFDLSVLGPAFASTSTIVDCVVEEVTASGALVRQWRMSDHVGIAEALTTPRLVNALSDVNGAPAADVFHCNSVDVDANGNFLVSARSNNAVFFINGSTGDIVWKLGGTPANLDGATILTIQNDPLVTISGQHDARFRPNGNVSLYDNHTRQTGPARGVEYAIDVNAGTATLVWQHTASDGTPAAATGSFRRSADGSANLIGWGFKTGYGFTEVGATGNVLLDVIFPNGEQTYRVVKQPRAAINVNLLRAAVPAPVPAGFRVTTTWLPAAKLGRPYLAVLGATDGVAPYQWKRVGKLPTGLRLNRKTGVITGTPKQKGIFQFTARATYKVKVKKQGTVRHNANRLLVIGVAG
jgi:hypothetical protein